MGRAKTSVGFRPSAAWSTRSSIATIQTGRIRSATAMPSSTSTTWPPNWRSTGRLTCGIPTRRSFESSWSTACGKIIPGRNPATATSTSTNTSQHASLRRRLCTQKRRQGSAVRVRRWAAPARRCAARASRYDARGCRYVSRAYPHGNAPMTVVDGIAPGLTEKRTPKLDYDRRVHSPNVQRLRSLSRLFVCAWLT
jgi:hypothetical protein